MFVGGWERGGEGGESGVDDAVVGEGDEGWSSESCGMNNYRASLVRFRGDGLFIAEVVGGLSANP